MRRREEKEVIQRGDIFYINNNRGQIGNEMKKDRPAIVVSCNSNNRYNTEITVVFLTSKPKAAAPTHVTVYSTGRKSTALCESPTTIDKLRVKNYLGKASKREMQEINEGLKIALGIGRKER